MSQKLVLLIVLTIVAAGLCSCSGGGNSPLIIATSTPTVTPAPTPTPNVTGACAALPDPSAPTFTARLNQFVMQLCYRQQNWWHDANRRSSQGLHAPDVVLWYSPSLYNWMTVLNRKGPVPDGSIVVKEEFADKDLTSAILFWSVMVRDSNLWWDGWDWAVVGSETGGTPAPTPAPSENGCSAVIYPVQGPTSVNCIGCHASAISNSPGAGTFSNTNFPLTQIPGPTPPTPIASTDTSASVAALMLAHAKLPGFVTTALGAHFATQANPNPASGFTDRLPSSIFANVRMLADSAPKVPCMVPQTQDFVTSNSASAGGPSLFLNSSQCASCHNATDNTPMPTHMLYTPPGAATPLNLSTAGEWQYSMMGLSGRDPIFFAQLNSESTIHDNIKGKPNPPGFVQDTCLSCHGVMGQRQFHLDNGNAPGTLFTRDQLQNPTSHYGALARDGVSCAVCHRIANNSPDDPSTFTGKFTLGPAKVVYGPYPSGPGNVKVGDNVIPQPMINSVGIVPVFGAQVAGPKVCASCHTIVLPVYDADGNQVMEGGVPKTDYEQTTYLEWLNSSFAAKNQPCQTCHMPDNYKGVKLAFPVANIEDSTFPIVPDIGPPTSLPADQSVLQTRTFYARHQLNGINVFALEMFAQFQADLGLFYQDGLLPPDLRGTVSAQKNAVAGAVLAAQTMTSQVTLQSATISSGQLVADVQVQNLAGHNLPSGVSFRRAFLDFQVLDAKGNVLWESGGTNSDGVIIDTAGNPLLTEFFSPTQQTFQPHFWTGNPIMSDEQVQIYEELVRDPQGQLTSSFLSLDNKVKDNRIQPKGWSPSGPNAGLLAPVGTGADPSYQKGCGCSLVRYQLPLAGALTNAAKVQATLYYQSIPPYYLRQRAEDASGPDTQRLINYTNQLNVGTAYPEIANWKLKTSSSGPVDIK